MAGLVDLIGKDYTITGYGRYLKTAEHDSLVIDVEKQVFYWNSKNISGDALDWLVKIKGLTFAEAKRQLGVSISQRLHIYQPELRDIIVSRKLFDSFFELGKHNREYWLNERGYTHSTIDKFSLGFSGEWYTIPIIVDGVLRNFQCRKANPKRLKYWYQGVGALPFNLDAMIHTKIMVLTEGPVDAIMCVQNGIPAMASSVGAGHFNPMWVSRLHTIERIYAVYDNDEAGRNALERIGEMLGFWVRGYHFEGFAEGYDITDFFKDGNTADQFRQLIKSESKVIIND